MTRFGTLIFCATLGVSAALLSCGGGGDNGTGGTGGGGTGGGGSTGLGGIDAVRAIMPASNEVKDWVMDTSDTAMANGPATATTMKGAVDLVDGGADSWWSSTFTPNVFGWQNYKNAVVNPPDGYTLKVYVLQMPSAAQATALHEAMMDGAHQLYTNPSVTWEDASVGDKARLANTLTDWWMNFRKGAYYCEMRLNYSEKTDLVGKQQTIDFAKALAAKM